jgi:hypothetical protein
MGAIFPPLANNPRVADTAYVVKVIKEGVSGPIEVGGQTFKGTMPPTTGVSEAEAQAIAGFVKGLGGARAQAAAPFVAEPEDVERGRALFVGEIAFENGGAPCMACHHVGNLGAPGGGTLAKDFIDLAGNLVALGGGTLGKDLTDLSRRLGGPGAVEAVLAKPAFPVMRASYAGKPFSAEEKRGLAAYLASLEQVGPTGRGGDTATFWLAGSGGMLGLFGLLALAQSRRRPSLAERIRAAREGKEI